ncbi:TRAP transporter large permease [Streptomyces sp. 4N509B]|uniref:TRAP transporter large permease n=1 Tax=Streptomyces sp. 4N509B TaxID=3457413 RepID=UPI003FD5A604
MIFAVLVIAVLLMLAGVPLWAVLFTSSFAGLVLSDLPMEVAPRVISNSLDNSVLLAVPGFVFVGELFVRSGMAQRLVDWITSLTGWIPGSLPITTVTTSELFGAISGSSPATVATIGRTLQPALMERGYGERFSLGLITSSGAIAIIIPPSIAMLVYGVSSNTSVADLFLAGVIPGVLVGVALTAYGVWYSLRHARDTRVPFEWRKVVSTARRAVLALGAPLVIFVGIYGGFVTPTEAAGVSALYVAVVALGERSIGLSGLFACAREAAVLTAKIFVIVASAAMLSFVLTISGVPQDLASLVGGDKPAWVTMLLVLLVLLVAGMFIEPTSAMVIFTPLLLPAARAQEIDPVHFGLVMTVAVAIGMFTPPFGLNLFVSQSMFKVSSGLLARAVMPFVALNVLVLVLVAYVPDLSLWLPDRL